MSKYYRVLKETPYWEEGAILEKNSNGYVPINDLFLKEIDGLDTNNYLEQYVVEASPDYFERVYHVKGLGKGKYVTKKIAKSLHNKDYKEV